jgi:hypothetical protein
MIRTLHQLLSNQSQVRDYQMQLRREVKETLTQQIFDEEHRRIG